MKETILYRWRAHSLEGTPLNTVTADNKELLNMRVRDYLRLEGISLVNNTRIEKMCPCCKSWTPTSLSEGEG